MLFIILSVMLNVMSEKVMKTCEKLRELGFHSIRMIEVRQRPFDGRLVVVTLNTELYP